MNNIQLELEKIIDHVDAELKDLSTRRTITSIGEEWAYTDVREKLTGLMEVITGVYPESQSRDLPE